LPGAVWASPVGAGPRAYFFGVAGHAVVLEPRADGPAIVAENVLPVEGRVYGVAAVDGAFVIRTDRELWRIGR
jgi:hypothetical protein